MHYFDCIFTASMKEKIMCKTLKVIRFYIKVMATIATIFVILAFTDIPYYAYHSLSLQNQQIATKADVIVLMGGDGMPSPNSLMRVYFTSKVAKEYESAKIVIAMPLNEEDSTYQLDLMASELCKNGIDSSRVLFEYKGYNTRSQALEIYKMFSRNQKLIIVSSPEHMFRAVKTFEKVGFSFVGSFPTFEIPSDEKMLKSKKKDVAEEVEIQDLTLRYNVWSYMQYEIRVLREYLAISYYWLKGWI